MPLHCKNTQNPFFVVDLIHSHTSSGLSPHPLTHVILPLSLPGPDTVRLSPPSELILPPSQVMGIELRDFLTQ